MANKSQFTAHLVMKNNNVLEKFQSEKSYKSEKTALKHIEDWIHENIDYDPVISWVEELSGSSDFKITHLITYYGAMNVSVIHYVK